MGKSGFGTLFGKSTRGLTMGVWNTHQYVGNIIGLSVAASYANEVKIEFVDDSMMFIHRIGH